MKINEQTIECPYCGKDIALSAALFKQIKDDLQTEFETKAKEKELELSGREKALEQSKKDVDKLVSGKLDHERRKLIQEARGEAEKDLQVEVKDMLRQIAEKDKKLEHARSAELELRRKTRELEEKQQNMELEVARKLDQEKEKIQQQTLEMFSEQHRLKDLEKDKKIDGMLKTIEELKRKAEQGSMQTQGEVLELDLENFLKARFPYDSIEHVPTGIRGADIIQRVRNANGGDCGTIIWELKNTKAWNNGWIEKLKDDQREIKAEMAVLATKTLPEGTKDFGLINGVWVTGIELSGSLAEALRVTLIELARSKSAIVGKKEKMEVLYRYLSGSEFKHKIEAIVETFKSMKEDLDKEKRAMTRIWSKRETQIERIVQNTAGMYGDMQGIIGASLPQIDMLELETGEDE